MSITLTRRRLLTASLWGVGAGLVRASIPLSALAVDGEHGALWSVAARDTGLVGLTFARGAVRVHELTVASDGTVTLGAELAHHLPSGFEPSALTVLDGRLWLPGVQQTAGDPLVLDHGFEGTGDGEGEAEARTEPDGPYRWVGSETIVPTRTVPALYAMDGQGRALPDHSAFGYGVAAAVTSGAGTWYVIQAPHAEDGDHLSSLTVLLDDGAATRVMLVVEDLGLAALASLVGPVTAPVLSVIDGEDRLRAWWFTPAGGARSLPSPAATSVTALHADHDRALAATASEDGLAVLELRGQAWRELRRTVTSEPVAQILPVSGAAGTWVAAGDTRALLVGEGR